MCGVVGFTGEPRPDSELNAVVEAMALKLQHRGPDDAGTFADGQAGLALGSRRLSIIDLSPNGHQPMVSASGRFVLVINGEIYNFLDLKKQLPSEVNLKGYSDAEVFLEHIDAFGFETTLKAATGMFACAIWDRKEKVLSIARDRFGEKPLYYGWVNGTFFFGSELKALIPHPNWRGEVDRDSLALLMRHGYIPDPYCIYRGFHKLTPGSLLHIPSHTSIPDNFDPHASMFADGRSRPKQYWSLIDVAEHGQENIFRGTEDDAINALEAKLAESVRMQMVSDRPLGAFLSGGIDSSLLVALMRESAPSALKTFTIGFAEPEFDESPRARAVAKHLGTEHHELMVTMDEAREVIPLLPTIYDEPFADVSQIPTYLLARMAREQVTVSLTGDGADELFGGYDRYTCTQQAWESISKYPKAARQAVSAIVRGMPDRALDAMFAAPRMAGGRFRKLTAKRARVATERVLSPSSHAYHCSLVSAWQHPAEVVKNAVEPATVVSDTHLTPCLGHLYERLMVIDSLSVLPGDLLVKVDRASMAFGLESRCPFLGHEVAEFAWTLPLNMKIRAGRRKWILNQLLYRHLPRELVDRPKGCFAVPIGSWLRGPLREWAMDLLSPRRLESEGFFQPQKVALALKHHLSGEIDNSHLLWPVLMFEMWYR